MSQEPERKLRLLTETEVAAFKEGCHVGACHQWDMHKVTGMLHWMWWGTAVEEAYYHTMRLNRRIIQPCFVFEEVGVVDET